VEELYRRYRQNMLVHSAAFLWPSTAALFSLWRRFRRGRPACVWAWTFIADVVVAPAARLAGVPRVVIRVENYSAWKTWPPHRRWWNRWADRNAARLADVVVVNAPLLGDDYTAWPGGDRRKIVVVPNGVDSARWLARPWRSRREELGVGPREVMVLTVSRLAREKNHALLLRASARLHQQGLGHRLVVVGDGPLREPLRNYAADLGVAQFTHWVGSTDAPQDFYRSANVFALSSDIEGLPNALLEAQLFALPAVTTAAGGAPWVVRHGETGWVVPVGGEEAFTAALAQLVRDEELRRRFGAAGQAHVTAEFSVQRWLGRVEAISRGEDPARKELV
ncbi:MAG: glycosyltransferase, partial [Thermoanaerobaculum sp.]|nr:glycosyltransferase [Thermoanaerobaculum sp.]